MKELGLTSKEGFKRRIERYAPKANVTDYAFIVTPKKYMVTLHFLEKQKKTIHCFDGKCCEDGHKTDNYTIYLIGVYTDYKDPEAPIDFQYIRATKSVDETIRNFAAQFEDEKEFCKRDLQLSLDTSVGEQYKKLAVTPVLTGGRKATKEQLLDLQARMKKVISYLETEIAQVITAEEYDKLTKEDTPTQPIKKVASKPVLTATSAKTAVDLGTQEAAPSIEEPEEEIEEIEDVETDINIDDLL